MGKRHDEWLKNIYNRRDILSQLDVGPIRVVLERQLCIQRMYGFTYNEKEAQQAIDIFDELCKYMDEQNEKIASLTDHASKLFKEVRGEASEPLPERLLISVDKYGWLDKILNYLARVAEKGVPMYGNPQIDVWWPFTMVERAKRELRELREKANESCDQAEV